MRVVLTIFALTIHFHKSSGSSVGPQKNMYCKEQSSSIFSNCLFLRIVVRNIVWFPCSISSYATGCSRLSTFVYAVHSTVNIIDLNGIEEALCKVLLACRCAYMISTMQSGCLSGVVCVVSLLGPVLLAVLIVGIHSWQSALRSIKRSAFESWFLNIRKPRLHRSRL